MMPIVGICGRSNSGKTTLIERLLPLLAARGRRVGVLKHDVHGFEMDREGSDTDRARAAGAVVAAIVGPNGIGSLSTVTEEPDPRVVVSRLFASCDLVIAEGFKRASWPKIEVIREAISTEAMTDDAAAYLADFAFDSPDGVPVLALDDTETIADQIGVLARRERGGETYRTSVVVDGIDIPLKPFLHDLIGGLVEGLLEGLSKTPDAPRTVEIRTRRDR